MRIFSVLYFVFFFPVFAVAEVGFIPLYTDSGNYYGGVDIPATGRVYLHFGGVEPDYDEVGQSYSVPAVVGAEVMAPTPEAAADGDTTNKHQFAGKEIVVQVPGTNIFQLADGSYENYYPSLTLASAYENLPEGFPFPSIELPDNLPPVGTVWEVPYGDSSGWNLSAPHRIKVVGAWSTMPANGSTRDAFNDGVYFESTFVRIYTFQEFVPPSTYHFHMQYASKQNTTDPLTEFGEKTPDALAAALTKLQANWSKNGLADDYKNACNAGGGCGLSGDISQGEVDSLLSSNSLNVAGIVSGIISSGAAKSVVDGTDTGAQGQQTGQLAGLQLSIDGIANDLEALKKEIEDENVIPSLGSPELVELDFSPLVNLQGLAMSHYPFSFFANVPSFFDGLVVAAKAPEFEWHASIFGPEPIIWGLGPSWDTAASYWRLIVSFFFHIAVCMFIIKRWS